MGLEGWRENHCYLLRVINCHLLRVIYRSYQRKTAINDARSANVVRRTNVARSANDARKGKDHP